MLASESKYLTIAAQIESELHGGAWENARMPSVRGIAGQYGVSVVTASRALQVLRDKGLIQTIERSGCYRVPPPNAEAWAFVLRLTPNTALHHTVALAQLGFQLLARREPMRLNFDAFEVVPGLTVAAAKAAAEQAIAEGNKGVFLLPARTGEADGKADETFLEGCKLAGLPVVLLERNTRGRSKLLYDLVSLDDVAAARECTEYLLSMGRRRIGLVVGSPITSHQDRVAGYLHTIHEARQSLSGTLPEPFVLHQRIDLPTKDVFEAVAADIRTLKLDAIIAYHDYLAIGVMMELQDYGLKVPRDVAIIGFDNLPLSQSINRGLSSYEFPTEAVAEVAVGTMRQRIAQPNRPVAKISVAGRLILRGSTQSE